MEFKSTLAAGTRSDTSVSRGIRNTALSTTLGGWDIRPPASTRNPKAPVQVFIILAASPYPWLNYTTTQPRFALLISLRRDCERPSETPTQIHSFIALWRGCKLPSWPSQRCAASDRALNLQAMPSSRLPHAPNNSSACARAEADLRSPSIRASSSRRAARLLPSGAIVTAVESSSCDFVTT